MPDDTTPAEALPEPPAPRPPTPPGMLRVRPLGTACVPRLDAADRNAGSRARGLFVGRAPQASKGVPPALPDGELVPDTGYYRRIITEGDLEVLP